MRLKMRNRQAIHFALIFIILIQLAGCAVGYITFKTEDHDAIQPYGKMANTKISYNVPDPLLRFSLERTLRARFHLLDVQPTGNKEPNINNESDRFLINAEKSSEPSPIYIVWGITSYLSFATIPAILDDDQYITFTIIAPGGEEKTFRYQYTERLYSWMPFMFFGPGFFATTEGYDLYMEDRVKTLDEITTRFVTEAATFILSRSTQ